ncbi:FAD-dependent oxidoreductase [Duganella violaceipulchra]|uniref:2-polyprenyl-6-methoxyphenol hydroxylase-like FAD-dependent oxidoreductase n=1 Tax=Duganella violaceipulchra TaxID=2849652 RepID=A0AA41H8I4_9BURK|nr:FAD-dependent monooxygenase [Duganella violaceicalia]MBV6321811.1 FAD-dependent monooxygenase [Duganella violaceicalia]MCP2007195.1 2-polyprenyl-6-methoxyphenol hydroxylase-like FAD-dependent oxidoreductase [Duganella violaceicalia]
MQKNRFRVAIIGAGPGGLCLAQGLKRQGIAFDVYERDAALDSRPQGYRLRINADGQAALRDCLPPQLYALLQASCAQDLGQVQALDVLLNSAAAWNDAWDKEPDLKAHRQTLREALLCGIADRVHFGKELRELGRHSDGRVSFDFADGTRCRADLLVGADGSQSRVAAQCFPSAGGGDTGAVCIYGKAALDSEAVAPLLRRGTSVVFGDDLALVLDAMRFADATSLTPVDDYLYWAMIGRRERFGLGAQLPTADGAVRRWLTTVSEHWATGLRAVFDATPDGTLAMLPVRQACAPLATVAGRVTALGDALHVMSPASGLGCNSALRDAAALATQLSATLAGAATLEQAVARYEHEMRLRAGAALAASTRGGQQLYGAVRGAADGR